MWEIKEIKPGDIVTINIGGEFKKENWFGDG